MPVKNSHQDFKTFETEDRFDLIVSNPPYFEESGSEKDKIARQTVELNFKQLISKAAELLSEKRDVFCNHTCGSRGSFYFNQ